MVRRAAKATIMEAMMRTPPLLPLPQRKARVRIRAKAKEDKSLPHPFPQVAAMMRTTLQLRVLPCPLPLHPERNELEKERKMMTTTMMMTSSLRVKPRNLESLRIQGNLKLSFIRSILPKSVNGSWRTPMIPRVNTWT
jgi:hypothetical protein